MRETKIGSISRSAYAPLPSSITFPAYLDIVQNDQRSSASGPLVSLQLIKYDNNLIGISSPVDGADSLIVYLVLMISGHVACNTIYHVPTYRAWA
jgi:hypothetical protein